MLLVIILFSVYNFFQLIHNLLGTSRHLNLFECPVLKYVSAVDEIILLFLLNPACAVEFISIFFSEQAQSKITGRSLS